MGSHCLLTGVREPLHARDARKNCGGHVEQEEILIFCRSFYIIASVIVMYRMSLKCCPEVQEGFYCGALSEDLWGVQGEQRRIKQYLRTLSSWLHLKIIQKPLLKKSNVSSAKQKRRSVVALQVVLQEMRSAHL